MRSRKRSIYEKHGDLYFITTTTVGFIEIFKHEPLREILIKYLKVYQDRGDYALIAYVIMPDHIHLIIKPAKNKSISTIIGNLKRITSREISNWLKTKGEKVLINELNEMAKLEPSIDCKVWKPRFDSLVLTKEETLIQKIEYIHNNPVKKMLVEKQTDWLYSSARNYAGISDNKIEVDTAWKSLNFAE